ncbi:MAG: DUF4831 family protein [Bacteroidales bacterium]|nr:DUF4831 family protein [Bacteroidales bacterium]
MIEPSGMVYALPQTVIKVKVEMLELKTIRGPYYRFAEKYLGINGVPEENKSEWFIQNVTLTTFPETDPEQYYLISPIRGTFEPEAIMYLSDEGLIMDLKKLDAFAVESKKTKIFHKTPGILFANPTITRNLEHSTDTLYKTILTDTSFIRIPVLKNEMIMRTIDERAEETADFIIEIRSRIFELLTGQGDFYPEGSALEFGISRLNELEEEYLSLFIGKTFEIPHNYNFWYIPGTGEVSENIKLFEYSDKNGISQEITGKGKTVNLLIEKVDKTKPIQEHLKMQHSENGNRIFYRIPDIAEVEIQDGGNTIFNERIPVYQYGTVLTMPVFR